MSLFPAVGGGAGLAGYDGFRVLPGRVIGWMNGGVLQS